MKIEFVMAEFRPNQRILDLTRTLFHQAALDLGLPVHALGLVLIADEERYGEAVHRICPEAGFTNNALGRAVGKAGTISGRDGSTLDAILIDAGALGCALSAVFGEYYDVRRDRAAEERCLHVVYHELAHCVDRRKRPDRPPIEPVRPGRGFEIFQFAKYHADIVEQEFAASRLAAPWVRPVVLEDLRELLKNQVISGRLEGAKLKAQHAHNPEIITTLASTVAGWCWSLLINVARLVGSLLPNAHGRPEEIWPEPNNTIVCELIRRFERALNAHWNRYPEWPAPPPFMHQTWQSLALLEGFKFVEDERRSAVYWR